MIQEPWGRLDRMRAAVLKSLSSGSTYRRGVYLLLGGVIALPYALLAAMFAMMFTQEGAQLGMIIALLTVTIVIASVPAFLSGTRALQIVAARSLLDVDLPDQPAGVRLDRESRLRSALWFAMHLLAGGVVALVLLIAMPMALALILQQFGAAKEAMAGLRIGPLDEHDTGWLTAIGVLLLVVTAFAVAGLGALAKLMAPALLGPSAAERIVALEAQSRQFAERNRLARELHDSIGHALTRTTLQATAAKQLLGQDDAFVAQALSSIEETGRAAMADLDHVLGLLREGGTVTPQRTLRDLDVAVQGDLARVPAMISREAYQIVQEGLTNAAKHGDGQPAELNIVVQDDLRLTITNTVGNRARANGRGLQGMRERVTLLGGTIHAGGDDGKWTVDVRLPL